MINSEDFSENMLIFKKILKEKYFNTIVFFWWVI